jgi:hypothetical protein
MNLHLTLHLSVRDGAVKRASKSAPINTNAVVRSGASARQSVEKRPVAGSAVNRTLVCELYRKNLNPLDT